MDEVSEAVETSSSKRCPAVCGQQGHSADSTVLYIRKLSRVGLKSSHHKKKDFCDYGARCSLDSAG